MVMFYVQRLELWHVAQVYLRKCWISGHVGFGDGKNWWHGRLEGVVITCWE